MIIFTRSFVINNFTKIDLWNWDNVNSSIWIRLFVKKYIIIDFNKKLIFLLMIFLK